MADMTNLIALHMYAELFEGTIARFDRVLEQIDREWLSRVTSRFELTLNTINNLDVRAKLLLVFAVGIWEKGYQTAPKLEFVVTEEE